MEALERKRGQIVVPDVPFEHEQAGMLAGYSPHVVKLYWIHGYRVGFAGTDVQPPENALKPTWEAARQQGVRDRRAIKDLRNHIGAE